MITAFHGLSPPECRFGPGAWDFRDSHGTGFRMMAAWNDLNDRIVGCQRCPRLVEYGRQVAQAKRRAFAAETYWGRPVPNFGDPRGRMLIVGLAPAAHGAHRTGRMFTGDRSGEWLYRALHRAGFANQAECRATDDGLQLIDGAITAACHCAPPDNRPTPEELAACTIWFEQTIDQLEPRVFVALGAIAWRRIVDTARTRGWWNAKLPRFAHGAEVALAEGRWLIGSYHPSQQNTFTGRLTQPMFDDVFAQARRRLEAV